MARLQGRPLRLPDALVGLGEGSEGTVLQAKAANNLSEAKKNTMILAIEAPNINCLATDISVVVCHEQMILRSVVQVPTTLNMNQMLLRQGSSNQAPLFICSSQQNPRCFYDVLSKRSGEN